MDFDHKMNSQRKSHRMPLELVAALYFAVISLIMVSVINGIPVPKDSHYFASRLPFYLGTDGDIVALYELLRAPVYEWLDWIYWSPLIYTLATFLGFFFLIYIPFFCLFRISKNLLASFFGALCFLPFIASLSALPLLGDYLSVSFPIHFGYQNDGFTTRVLTGMFYSGIVYTYHMQKFKTAMVLLFVCFLCHPNNALSIGVVMLMTLIGLSIANGSIQWRNMGYWVVVVCLGVLPALLKTKELPVTNLDSFSAYDWHRGLIFDEGDDFSSIYYAKFFLFGQLKAIIFPMLVIYVCKKLEKTSDDYLCLYMLTISPVLGYLIFLFFEVFVHASGFWGIMEFMIPSQLGMKIIELSYFPMIFCLVIIMSRVGARWKLCA